MFELVAATASDASTIAKVFSPSLRTLTFLPALHSLEEDRWFIEHVILKECAVILAVRDRHVVSFLALQGEEIRLLHTHPSAFRQGAGSLLLQHVQSTGPSRLKLWCFQQNNGARRFYERHGFKPDRFTNGEGNEENLPDVLYVWQR